MKTMKSIVHFSLIAVAVGFVFYLTGCASSHPPYGAAEFISNPPGADVINVKDNKAMGTTPFTYVRKTEESEAEYITVKVTKPGYEDKIVSFLDENIKVVDQFQLLPKV